MWICDLVTEENIDACMTYAFDEQIYNCIVNCYSKLGYRILLDGCEGYQLTSLKGPSTDIGIRPSCLSMAVERKENGAGANLHLG